MSVVILQFKFPVGCKLVSQSKATMYHIFTLSLSHLSDLLFLLLDRGLALTPPPPTHATPH